MPIEYTKSRKVQCHDKAVEFGWTGRMASYTLPPLSTIRIATSSTWKDLVMGEELTKFTFFDKDRDRNAARALLKLLQGNAFGAIEQLAYGVSDAREKKRVEDTWKEIKDKLEAKGQGDAIDGNEDMEKLVWATAGPLGQATNEDARKRFRDLLFNSATIPQGDPMWEESFWCLEMLQKLRPAALAMLAKTAICNRNNLLICYSHMI